MKKIYYLLLATAMVTSCDDGDVKIDEVGLNNVTMKKCSINNLLYKIEGNSSLALDLDQDNYNTLFANNVSDVKPLLAINNNSVKLIYRIYNGDVNDGNLCGVTLNPFPNIQEQWEGIAGFIQVKTTATKSIDPETQATRILDYRHSIVLKTIGWQKTDGTIQEVEDRPFGQLTTPIANVLPFGFVKTDLKLLTCSTTKKLVNIKGNEALELQLNAETFSLLFPIIPVIGTKTGLLSNTNLLSYKLFDGLVTEPYFCTLPIPNLPLAKEKWEVVDDTNPNTGIIEVKTTALGTTQVTHTVVLKNVTLSQGTNNFFLGSQYELGSFIVNLNP